MKSLLLITFVCLNVLLSAQLVCPYKNVFGDTVYGTLPQDKLYKKHYVKPEAYDSLPEQEIVVATRLIKSIDFSDKTNKAMFNISDTKKGLTSFFQVLEYGIIHKKIRVFKTNNYELPNAVKLTCEEVINKLVITDSVDEIRIDENGIETNKRILKTDTIKYSELKALMVDEVWYFNKKWSRLEKRIVGVGPYWHNPKTNKDEVLFWIYYKEERDLFASFANNSSGTAGDWKTYDEIFMRRFFNCYIVKEYNIFDRNKLDNGKAFDDVMESERAKEKVLNKEDDMWEK